MERTALSLLVPRWKNLGPKFQKSKKRVTLMACTNASGTCKLPLVLVQSSKNPRGFRHLDMGNLPLLYYAQKNSWMNREIFQHLFDQKFVPKLIHLCARKGIEYKGLLLLKNASSHSATEKLQSTYGKVTAMFLTPNITSVIHLIDQGVLAPLRLRYRKPLLRFIVARCGSAPNKTVPEIVKEVNINNAVYWAIHAWDDVTASSFKKSWRHLLPAAVLPTPAPDMAATSCSVVESDVTLSDASAAGGDQSATASEPPEDCNTGIDDSEPPEHGSLSVADLFTSLGYEVGSEQWQTCEQWLTSDEDDAQYG